MNSFLQHIVYTMSVDRKTGNRNNSVWERATKLKQPDRKEKKKYCLEYNKGTCSMHGPHEGFLNGVKVTKHHICKRCLMDEGVEKAHPSKECTRK